MPKNHSELTVITHVKELFSYVMTVTQKSSKQIRFTFVSRLQNLSVDVIEKLYRSNDTFITKNDRAAQSKRLEFQHSELKALT